MVELEKVVVLMYIIEMEIQKITLQATLYYKIGQKTVLLLEIVNLGKNDLTQCSV